MDGYVKDSLHLYNCNDNASLRKAVFTVTIYKRWAYLSQIKKQINSVFFLNPHMFKNEKLQKTLFNLSAITDKGSSCNHMA